MSSSRTHLYYGAIDSSSIPVETSASAKSPERSNRRDGTNSPPLSSSVQEHRALIAAYEVQKAAHSVVAPSLDKDVQARLRELGEPICLFGEGPYERRERLKLVMARQSIKSLGIPQEVAVHVNSARLDQQQRLFFSQGGGALLAARKEIARYSLPRAVKRLKQDKLEFDSVDPLEVEHRVASYNSALRKKVEVLSSQVASERPMACGQFAPQSYFLATSSWSPGIRIWQIPSNKELSKGLTGHKERVNFLSWNPNFSSSAVRSTSYETLKNATYQETELDTEINYSSGWHLASGSFDASLGIWRLDSATPIHMLKGHEDRINRIASHPSGRFVASTSHDETWRLWDVDVGIELLVQEGHSTGCYGLKFHPDGSLVFTGDLGGIIRGWDLRTGRTAFPLLGHVKQVLGISVNPWRTNHVATCSDDNTVRIWDIRKQRSIDLILAHDKLISDVVYEPTHGRYLMTTSYDQSMKLWSSTEFTCSAILREHESRVTGGDISPDGDCLVTVAFDRTFKLWTFTKNDDEDDADGDLFGE